MTSQDALWTVVTVLALLVLILTLLVIGLLRRATPVLERAERLLAAGGSAGALEGLPVGALVDSFVVDAADRQVPSTDVLTSPLSTVLFLSTHCEPCQRLSAEMAGRHWDNPSAPLVVVQSVDRGSDPLPVVADAVMYTQGESQPVSAAFGTNISPHAFVVESNGTVVAKVVPESLTQLWQVAAQAADVHRNAGSAQRRPFLPRRADAADSHPAPGWVDPGGRGQTTGIGR